MGTEINLDVGGVTIDWAKNNPGVDHGSLFQENDRKRIKTSADGDPSEDGYDALVRQLSRILPRLNLLGNTIDTARAEYNALLSEYSDTAEEVDMDISSTMSFDEFCSFVGRYSIQDLDETYCDSYESTCDVRGVFMTSKLKLIDYQTLVVICAGPRKATSPQKSVSSALTRCSKFSGKVKKIETQM